ncbi:MAG: hypothetical protein ACE5GE_09535 [Phycisphaerae bacterium]
MKTLTRLGVLMAVLSLGSPVVWGEPFQLVTGVAPGTSPGSSRFVSSSGGFPAPGEFFDGQRLGGTPDATATSYQGQGTPIFSPNQFGSLSYIYRRGTIPAGAPGSQIPIMSIDYLGGPLLDLDGDLNNGTRSLIPVSGQSAVAIPGSRSFIDLTVSGSNIGLNGFDASSSNAGSAGLSAEQVISVQNLAGTSTTGAPGGPVNPGIDTRTGTLTPFATGVTQISGLGYEIWSDSLDIASSTASTLGTLQNLGSLRGWLVERDGNGNFPTLAGLGLGSTLWPNVDASQVGNVFNTTLPAPNDQTSIVDGVLGDDFTVAGNGGLPLIDFGGDLGAYLDAVVVPAIDPLSGSFVFLESAGFGINNSVDPIFHDSVGYDLVVVAQSAPVPEPGAWMVLTLGAALIRRRKQG